MAFSLTQETLDAIDKLVPRYPDKRSATLPLLHHIQAEKGYIANEAIEWVAERLELQPINVYEVVTFYPGFRQTAPGKKILRVCRTLPCALRGAYKTCQTLQEELGVDHLGGNSEDGEFTVEFVECLASCGTAPVLLVGDDLHENVDEAAAKELATKLKAEAGSAVATTN